MKREQLIAPLLTPKQANFVEEYIKDLNATQAAIRAGYSPNGAKKQGFNLLRHPHIYPLIQAKQRARLTRLEVRADDVIDRIRRIAACDLRLAYDQDTGQPLRAVDLPDDLAPAVDAIKTDEHGTIISLKLSPRLHALELLARHLDLLRPDLVPAPDVSLTQVNVAQVYLDRLSTDELKTLDALLERAGMTLPDAKLPAPPETTSP